MPQNSQSQISSLAGSYASYFAVIAPDTLDRLEEMLAPDVTFIDPFNHIKGRAPMVAIFRDMFETMTNPKFEILDIAYSDRAAYLKWRMSGIVNAAPAMPFDILGMSEVVFDEKGQVTLHHDHWDSASQLLSHLPYIGWVTKRIARLFQHK